MGARARVLGIEALPRAINMITGPSCSADTGQIMILGAHDPRRVHALVREIYRQRRGR